jgi:RNA-binding protein Musashi
MDEDKKVFVGNLPPTSFTNKGLREFFEKFGPVRDAFVLRDAQTNRGRRCGIVTFDDSETAEHVKALKDHDMALKLKGNRYFRIASDEPIPKNVVATNVSSWPFYDPDDSHSDVIDSSSDVIKSTRDVSIDALNDYCLLHIFEFFTLGYSINFERVCKRWKKLLRTRWTRLTK